MKTGFKNPLGVEEGKKIKSPFNFDAPPYDERSSCFIKAGTNYGLGHRQPVGHPGNANQRADTMPVGKVNTQEVSYVLKGKVSNVELELE